MGTNAGPAAGAAVILIGVMAIMIWKGTGKHSKIVHWIALAAGLCGSYVVVGYLGSLATWSLYGVGGTALVVIFGGMVFWYEAIKGKGAHKFRTPAIAFTLGVALMAGSSGVQHIAQHATDTVTTVVDHTVSGVNGGR
jgi:hypothetical protein